jgi:hypothetical protein
MLDHQDGLRPLRPARAQPDYLTAHSDLNVTLVTELDIFIILFSVLPRCRQSRLPGLVR